jgi:hypothetical protein
MVVYFVEQVVSDSKNDNFILDIAVGDVMPTPKLWQIFLVTLTSLWPFVCKGYPFHLP